jgi:hypothetical protein
VGSPTPVFVPKESTPLEEHDADSVIPNDALWAMKYRGHGHFLGRAESLIRERYGSGDGTEYVIDDGRRHCPGESQSRREPGRLLILSGGADPYRFV